MERLQFVGHPMALFVVILFILNASTSTSAASESNVVSNGVNCSLYNNCTPTAHKKESGEGISVAKINFSRVDTPLIVAIWILLGSLAKLVFHLSDKLSSLVPESCLLILLGIPIGLVLKELGVKDGDVYFTSELFFLFLLPPIILDAGYFMPVKVFYQNIGTILLYATVGTVFNAFALGCALYLVRDAVGVNFPLLHLLLFGSFIAAVDPVAVLAVFEEVHVHETLYILVFGESVLNDAASVVLYNTFEALTTVETVRAKDIGLAFVSFFVVSVGGTSIGIVWGLLTSFVTRFTEHVRVIEPIFVFIMAYMAYLCAELFHFSGIMSILFCGMVMKPYVESNVSRKSHTTIKYFLKLIASTSETIIFMFLGASLILNKHLWNVKFIFFTLFFMVLFRTIGVIAMTAAANTCGRLIKISKVEQFIMSYGGLRGAVAFSLSILINVQHVPTKQVLVTTTIIVVLFTVFLQGITIKPLVRWLRVKRAESREKTMSEQLNDKLLEHLVAGMEEILGHHGHGFWRDVIEYYNRKYLRRLLERDPDQGLDQELIAASRRLAFKNALDLAQNPNQLFQKEDEWSCVRRNPSYAVALAMRENSSLERGDPQLDIGVLTGRCFDDEDYSEAFIHYNAACVIPRAKRSLRQRASIRKYSLASLGENEYEERYMKVKRNALAHMAPAMSHHHHRHRGKHRRHNKRGHSKKPGVDTLPEMTEDERDSGPVLDRKASIASESSEPDSVGIVFNVREDDPHHAYSEDIPMIKNPFNSERPRKDSGANKYFRRDSGEPGRGFLVNTPPPARREIPRSPPQDSSPPFSQDSSSPLTQSVPLALKENSISPTDNALSQNSEILAMEDPSKMNHDDPSLRSAGDVHIDVPDDSKD